MNTQRPLTFGAFRLDPGREQLWRGDASIPLTAKAFAVLHYLLEHAGQLVTRDTLLEQVWGTLYVSDAALASCIRDIRRALDDTAQQPQFIETVRGRGYRFVAPVIDAVLPLPFPPVSAEQHPPTTPATPLLVGRDADMAHLHQSYAAACQGTRQMVFITGEAGIGKTALVDAFVADIVAREAVRLGRGQCIEQHGAGEAYLPLLEALGRLGRAADGAEVVALLTQQAPSWLLHLPALVPAAAFDTLQQRASATTRERMLRELAEAVETLTAVQPLILLLEDLHWSDVSTLDWLAYVARRREPARLLVLGTYRPVEAMLHDHPVRTVTQELRLHQQCHEVALDYLQEGDVARYLASRSTGLPVPGELARLLHRRTSGNPLFLVTLVDDLMRQGRLRVGAMGWEFIGDVTTMVDGVPESLRQVIERHLEQLPAAEQAVLEAASVAGQTFAVAVVAAVLEQSVEAIEGVCDALARRGQFLHECGTDVWPDGTVATRYGFIHDLYRETVYARVPAGRRVLWHRHIGRRLESGYGPQAQDIATELAGHFVRGREAWCAAQYLQYAGEQALQRMATAEAVRHLRQGLEGLETLPETPERARRELALLMPLGSALMVTRGFAAPEVEQVYGRAQALCHQIGEQLQLLPTLRGLWHFYNGRQLYPKARELAEQYLALAPQAHDTGALVEAHNALGCTLFRLGELPAARQHYEQILALYDPQWDDRHTWRTGQGVGVSFLAFLASVLDLMGYPEQGRQRTQAALELARQLDHPYTLAFAKYRAGLYDIFHRQAQAAQQLATEVITLAVQHDFAFFHAMGVALHGQALAMQGHYTPGLEQLLQGLSALQEIGQLPATHWWLFQAELYARLGQPTTGLRLLVDALELAETTGERNYAAELYRLQGELLLQQAGGEQQQEAAVQCFHQAQALARQQHARSLELRAAMSLSRLWQQQGAYDAAHDVLAEVYDWFTEGFETADLQEARALLETLCRQAGERCVHAMAPAQGRCQGDVSGQQ